MECTHKKCSKDRACEILGECVFGYPAVKDDEKAKRAIVRAGTIKGIVRVLAEKMPNRQYQPVKPDKNKKS